VRLDRADSELVERLQADTGIKSVSDLLRLGLRSLAKERLLCIVAEKSTISLPDEALQELIEKGSP
jgi:hypothetical protein